MAKEYPPESGIPENCVHLQEGIEGKCEAVVDGQECNHDNTPGQVATGNCVSLADTKE